MTSNISTERNRAKCIICYDPHSSLENGPGVQREFAESSGLLQRAFDIKLPTSFNEYGEISICSPCFKGQFQEVELLYGRLIEIENEFKSKGYNLATTIIDSVYKSQYLNQNLTAGNAFDSTRSLTFHKWLSCYTKDKETATAAESNVELEEMDVEIDNVEDEVKITTQSSTEITTVLNKSKSIQSDSNSLVNGKLEKIATADASTSGMTTEDEENENEESTEVADDSDSGHKNPNTIIAHGNGVDTCVKNQDQQQIEPNVPTTTITTMNKSNVPLTSGNEVIFLKRSNPVPINQKVGHTSASARRPQVQEEYVSMAKFALKPVTFLGLDLDKFKRKKLIYVVRDQGTGELKIEHRKPPSISNNNVNHLDLINERKIFTLVRDDKVGNIKIIPNRLLESINKSVQVSSSSAQVLSQSREPTPPLLSRFDVSSSSDSDNEVGEVSFVGPNVSTTTITAMNKFNEPLTSGKEVIFIERSNPVKQKVGRPSASYPKKKSTSFVNLNLGRSPVQEASRKKLNLVKGYFPVKQRVGRPRAVYPKGKSQVQENQLQRQEQYFKFHPKSGEISREVKRSKRTIKKPMHYDEQNYIYDSAGNGKEMVKLMVQERRRKLNEQKEAAARSIRINRSANQSPEELEADDEDEDEELGMEGLVYVPNKWKPSTDNPVDSEEEDIDLSLVKYQEFVIENSEGEEIDCVDFKGRKRNSNGIGQGQGQKTNSLVVKEEVDEEMTEKEKLTEVKLESSKFKCVFCSKFFSSLEMKIEHEVWHAVF